MTKDKKNKGVKNEKHEDKKSKQIEQLEKELAEMKESKLRAVADLENYRKRMEVERESFGLMANMAIVNNLMEILDEVSMATNDEDIDLDRAMEVIELFRDKLMAALNIAGVEKITIDKGDRYDAEQMEAITTVPVEDKKQDNTVVDVIAAGFKYANSDKLIKPAKVVVGKLTK